jgi:integrase
MDSIKYLDTMGIEALFSVAKGRDRLYPPLPLRPGLQGGGAGQHQDFGYRFSEGVHPSYPQAQARVVSGLMSGVPLPTVQKQVGHKRLSTTTIYATVAPALVKEAYNMQGSGR